jgi:hypothetical protein
MNHARLQATAMTVGRMKDRNMRHLILALSIVLCPMVSAAVPIDVAVGFTGIDIGINMPTYPELVLVPGYPVYYDPHATSNYFFYDGQYWVYQDNNWYSGAWYNGPWQLVGPEYVPLFVLRVPVRYYSTPPVYFRGWNVDAAPRWGEHWGHEWAQRHGGWDRWDNRGAASAAPLPIYQKQYAGDRYPQAAQQRSIRSENYHYKAIEVATLPAQQDSTANAHAESQRKIPARRQTHVAAQDKFHTNSNADRGDNRP